MKYLATLLLAALVCVPVSAQRSHKGKVSHKPQVERTVKCEKACKCVCHKSDRKHTDRKRGDRKRGDRKGQRVRGRRFDSNKGREYPTWKKIAQKPKKVRARIAQVRKKLEQGKK